MVILFSIHLPTYLHASLTVVTSTGNHSTPLPKHCTYMIEAACHFSPLTSESELECFMGSLITCPVSWHPCATITTILAALLQASWNVPLSRLPVSPMTFCVHIPHFTATVQHQSPPVLIHWLDVSRIQTFIAAVSFSPWYFKTLFQLHLSFISF